MESALSYCRNVLENPCHACMPMGAIIPFKGIKKAMVMIHGSQGCSTYMRRHLSEHYNEPIDVASSSINEKGTIYGGGGNLKQGLDNLITVYQPELVGVLSTCLAETIGEDIERITSEYRKERGMEDFPLISVSTPGYGGSHTEGYHMAVRQLLFHLAHPGYKHNRINLIVPNISPADLREIKRILDIMGVSYILCPDYSDTLDSPFMRFYRKIPEGGTSLADLRSMAGAAATIEIGNCVEDSLSPGKFLEDTYGVELFRMPIPMGIEATDRFVSLLQDLTGRKPPLSLKMERGRLLDGMIDSHKYNSEGRAAVFGEPEVVLGVVRTCLENGIAPALVATGSRSKLLELEIEHLTAGRSEKSVVLTETDFSVIRKKALQCGVNIAIGHSDGRYLTEREGIPLVRLGFPIHDRVGGQRLLSVSYTGTMMFLDRVTNTFLERKLADYRQTLKSRYYFKESSL